MERTNRIASWTQDELGNYAVTLESGTILNLYPNELDQYGYVEGVRRPYKVGDRFQALSWWKQRTARVVAVEAGEVVAVVNVVTYPGTRKEERFKQLLVFDADVDVKRTWGAVSVWCKRVYSSFNKSVPKKYRKYLEN